MSGGIYLIHDDGGLVEMTEQGCNPNYCGQNSSPFDEEPKRLELRDGLNDIPQVNISAGQISGKRS